MLREVRDWEVERRGVVARRYAVRVGGHTAGPWRASAWRALRERSDERPVALGSDARRTYWLFEDRVWWEDEDCDSRDVLALVRERERRARRRLERAHASLAAETVAGRREAIPREVRLAVFERDGGACVECGARFELQYDHVIPVALGGATTVENLQVLCAPCNRRKGAALA